MPRDIGVDSNASLPERQQFQIIKRKTNAPDEVTFGGKTIKLGKRSGAATVSDIGWAREFNAVHGAAITGNKNFLVIPTEKRSEPAQKRSFLVRLPKGYKREADEHK